MYGPRSPLSRRLKAARAWGVSKQEGPVGPPASAIAAWPRDRNGPNLSRTFTATLITGAAIDVNGHIIRSLLPPLLAVSEPSSATVRSGALPQGFVPYSMSVVARCVCVSVWRSQEIWETTVRHGRLSTC